MLADQLALPRLSKDDGEASLLSGATQTQAEIISRNPATGAELGRVPIHTAHDVNSMIKRARAAQKSWARESFAARAAVILRAREIALAEMEAIADLIAAESGKPAAEAIAMEIVPSLDLMNYFATHSARLLRSERIELGTYELLGRTSRIIYKPLGVIGIIAPWNFPYSIPMGEIVMALMAGNSVILKPSELTPLVGLKLKDILTRAGLNNDLLHIATGDAATGAALAASSIDKIMFTGSVATGRKVAVSAANNLTPVVLELGGKDPMIVCRDADVVTAAHAAVWGAFANSGQACASVERLFVHTSIANAFIAEAIKMTARLRQRKGQEVDSDVAAMSSARQLAIVESHVADAQARGAKVLIGGKRNKDFERKDFENKDFEIDNELENLFYEPTILVDVNDSMRVMHEETFGPVLPIITFETEDEAIKLANDSEFGLTASVWTRDIARGQEIARQIDAGTVTVNEVLYTHGLAATPWGGIKKSGIGRTHGRLGLLELVYPQHIHTNRFSSIKNVWWFSYTPAANRLFRTLARRFTKGSILQSALALPHAAQRFFELRKKI